MNQKVIDLLNEGRARELGAIIQYMEQHYELEDDNYDKLADIIKKIAIVEMKHAEAFAERILFLGGTPTSRIEGTAKKNEDIAAMLATDRALERDAIDLYNRAAGICAEEGDHVSRQLFSELAEVEEDHLNDFDNIAEHVKQLGPAYLATLTG